MKRDISVRNDLFGFHTTPFTSAPAEPFSDERRTRCRRKADAFMHRRGFAFVTGGPGCGKTLFVNELCSSQNSRTTNVMYIPFAMFGDTDMLREICRQIGIEPAYRMGAMIRNIQERISEMQPVNPILVIDEVQLIGQETLDMLRILTNFKFESANLFTVIMAGDESFQHRLQLRINEPLRQRVTLFVALDGVDIANSSCIRRQRGFWNKLTQEYVDAKDFTPRKVRANPGLVLGYLAATGTEIAAAVRIDF